jgi:hypothetical protein
MDQRLQFFDHNKLVIIGIDDRTNFETAVKSPVETGAEKIAVMIFKLSGSAVVSGAHLLQKIDSGIFGHKTPPEVSKKSESVIYHYQPANASTTAKQ